ncbi:MAG: AAA family ATPase, partial [Patescibacteria group bacterium]
MKEIIVTGGPCSGKTQGIWGKEDEGIEGLKRKLGALGFRVFITREVATDVILGGVHDLQVLAKKDPQKYLEIQNVILQKQLDERKHAQNLAALFPDEPRVILYDRGPKDGEAYLPEGRYQKILKELGLTGDDVCYSFDAVIHMVAAADGAETHYNLGNEARSERSLEDLRNLDARTLAAYIGHPHLFIIDNSTDFKTKVDERLYKAVLRTLGIPEPLEIERKFLVEYFHDSAIPKPFRSVAIEQIYIDIPYEYFYDFFGKSRIRKERYDEGLEKYYLVQKIGCGKTRGEVEVEISWRDHSILSGFIIPRTTVIRKFRNYFVYKHQYFMLDTFESPSWAADKNLCLLEIELIDENDKVELP